MAPLATESITEAAATLIQAGYPVCRIDPKEKKPTYGSWQLKSLQPQDFAEDENIGIVFGLRGHAGVDLDFHPEDADAWDAADEILPYTEAIEGRPGVPTAHRIYRITDPENCTDEELPGEASETRAAIDAGRYPRFPGIRHFSSTTGRQIDFLLAGGQAACPPSYHASSGTRREWLNGEMGEPTPVTWAVLRDAVYRLCEHLGMDVSRREKAAPVSAELLARVDGNAEAKRAVARLQRQTPKQHGMSQNYHGQQYAVACDLAEHGIPEELAWPIFREWNQNTLTVDADPVLKDSLRRAYKAACFGCRAEVVRAPKAEEPVEEARPVGPLVLRTHRDRLHSALAPKEIVIHELLEAGHIGALIALPNQGKSLVAAEMARCVAGGDLFAGKKTAQGTVIYACTDSPASTENRLASISDGSEGNILSAQDLILPRDFPAVEQACRDHRCKLLIVDTWDSSRTHATGGYTEIDAALEELMRALRKLASELHMAVLITHHATRQDDGRARGSVVFDARADWIGLVKQDTETAISVVTTKGRDIAKGHLGTWDIILDKVGPRTVPRIVFDPNSRTPKKAKEIALETLVMNTLKCDPPGGGDWSYAKLAEATKKSKGGALTKVVESLREDGRVINWTVVKEV